MAELGLQADCMYQGGANTLPPGRTWPRVHQGAACGPDNLRHWGMAAHVLSAMPTVHELPASLHACGSDCDCDRLGGIPSGVRWFMMKAVAAAQSSGAASTLMGRRRTIPGLSSADFQERSAAERKVVNSQIQVG